MRAGRCEAGQTNRKKKRERRLVAGEEDKRQRNFLFMPLHLKFDNTQHKRGYFSKEHNLNKID
jgi:hypothetical protein